MLYATLFFCFLSSCFHSSTERSCYLCFVVEDSTSVTKKKQVLQHMTVLSHAVGQSDVLPGDFEPSPNGGLSLDKKYMRHDLDIN